MKDEVPPSVVDAHIKNVLNASKDGKPVDPTFGLEKSGIAGTGNIYFKCFMSEWTL